MIFVTDASGLIGRLIVQQLLDDNQSIRILLSHGTQTDPSFAQAKNIEIVYGHLTDFEEYDDWLKNIRTVVHCDALSPYNLHKKATLFRRNYGVTKDLINHCLTISAPPHFIYISHIESFGQSPTTTHWDEVSRPSDITRNTDYSNAKNMADMEVYRGQLEGINTLTLHIAHIIEPSVLTRFLNQSRYLTPNTIERNDNRFLSYVDARDIAQAVSIIIQQKTNAQSIILSADSINLACFLGELDKINSGEVSHLSLEKTPVSFFSKATRFVSQLFGFKSDSIIQTLFKQTKYNNALSKELLNLDYHTLADTLVYTTKISKKKHH